MPKSVNRLTVEGLRYYVPIYQMGDDAEDFLLNNADSLTAREINHLESLSRTKEIAVRRVADFAGPLITRELNKLISGSHLKSQENVFNILYYAGLSGMRRGLRKFDVEKLKVSSTNYLFQWIVAYARKELTQMEAPYGIPPSRFANYKKISAVRKRMSEKYNKTVSNEEIFEYFQSGQADIKTMTGRVGSSAHASKANQQITLALIKEQELFEKNMLSIDLIDPLDTFNQENLSAGVDETPFSETIFGTFMETYPMTLEAKSVITSYLNPSYLTADMQKIVQEMPKKTFNQISNQWKNLVKDVNGPFYRFLLDNADVGFDQFDVKDTINAIERYPNTVDSSKYEFLFEEF